MMIQTIEKLVKKHERSFHLSKYAGVWLTELSKKQLMAIVCQQEEDRQDLIKQRQHEKNILMGNF